MGFGAITWVFDWLTDNLDLVILLMIYAVELPVSVMQPHVSSE